MSGTCGREFIVQSVLLAYTGPFLVSSPLVSRIKKDRDPSLSSCCGVSPILCCCTAGGGVGIFLPTECYLSISFQEIAFL